MEDLNALFKQVGFSELKAKETAGNKKLSLALKGTLDDVKVSSCEWSFGALYYELAANIVKEDTSVLSHRAYIASRIKDGSLKSKEQVLEAIKFAREKSEIKQEEFDIASGVGVEVSEAEIAARVTEIFHKNEALVAANGMKALGSLIKLTKEDLRLKWADGKTIKLQLDKLLENCKQSPEAKKKKPTPEVKKEESADLSLEISSDPFFMQGELSKLHKPGGNKQVKPELMERHLKETGGIVVTRFPPEPNGHLHIGHAKAININFGYAKAHGGICNLRYDDTNPAAEEEEYFTSIKDSVEWLGFKPAQITYSSDHFQKLYDLAVELIKRDKAYICHCTAEEMHAARGGDEKGPRLECKHRNRPIEESLREFTRMKSGEYKESEATLRMKMDMQNPSPQFWDLVAYRVVRTPHYRTKSEWIIYPTYDYTHCLVDSFENITHSLCTTEFRLSRESYYWLVDALEVYKPVQWEYGRLNITKTVLSKRKLMKLVTEKIVNGWDDPRLYTLIALKRRGVPPEAINKFVRDCGVTTAVTTVDVRKLDYWVRQYLDSSAPRVFAVQEPIMLVLVNLDEEHYEEFQVPYYPKTKTVESAVQSRCVPFTRMVFIEKSDFKENGASDANFYRLSVGSIVGLLHLPYPVYCRNVIKAENGDILGLECLYLKPDLVSSLGSKYPVFKEKPKAHIQWLAFSPPSQSHTNRINSPIKSEIRIYNDLFLHDNPMDKVEVPGGWLSDINPNSLEIRSGFVEGNVRNSTRDGSLSLKQEDKVQFVRDGYYAVDKDTKESESAVKIWVPEVKNQKLVGGTLKSVNMTSGWVWNRTVNLKEDGKKDAK